jgi:hypothetical protein
LWANAFHLIECGKLAEPKDLEEFLDMKKPSLLADELIKEKIMDIIDDEKFKGSLVLNSSDLLKVKWMFVCILREPLKK